MYHVEHDSYKAPYVHRVIRNLLGIDRVPYKFETRVTGVRVVYVADPRKLALATSRITVANLEPLEAALGKRVLKLVA